VTDITYVELADGRFCYAAFATDAFSRAIVGWQVSDGLKTELALDALDMAWWARAGQTQQGACPPRRPWRAVHRDSLRAFGSSTPESSDRSAGRATLTTTRSPNR
jgi:transposase InsO family protein